jgi:spermidine synthase
MVTVLSDLKYIELPIHSACSAMRLQIRKTLAHVSSPFQDILVIDSEDHGKCLILDNEIQSAESDHHLYDEEMLKLLKNDDKRLLILGGGDGYVAQKAISHNERLRITMVEMDAEVIRCSSQHLGQQIFEHPSVDIYTEDALEFLQAARNATDGKYDGIVCDLTDSPIGKRELDDFSSFYEQLIPISVRSLTPDGWFSIQAGASKTNNHHINAVSILEKLLLRHFRHVFRSDLLIPSYGEECAFLAATRKNNLDETSR